MTERERRLSILVVDDEPLARRGVRTILETHGEFQVVGECGSGSEAVEAIREKKPDVVLLDIQMPGMDGFDVVAALDETERPAIVFVTAHDEHALRAFGVHAIDYVLKPFDEQRLLDAVRRAGEQMRSAGLKDVAGRLAALLEEIGQPGAIRTGPRSGPPPKRVAVREGARTLFVKLSDVDWIEAADYYASLHVGRVTHLIRESLSSLEQSLDPSVFQRVHRTAIVNVERIREIHSEGRGDAFAVLHDGTRIPISKTRRSSLQQAMKLHR